MSTSHLVRHKFCTVSFKFYFATCSWPNWLFSNAEKKTWCILYYIVYKGKKAYNILFVENFHSSKLNPELKFPGPQDPWDAFPDADLWLTLTRPIGLPPRTPFAQKIAVQRSRNANSAQNRDLFISNDVIKGWSEWIKYVFSLQSHN